MLSVYFCVYLKFNVFRGRIIVLFKRYTKNKLLSFFVEIDDIIQLYFTLKVSSYLTDNIMSIYTTVLNYVGICFRIYFRHYINYSRY